MRTIVLVLVLCVLTFSGCSNKENITTMAGVEDGIVTKEIQLLEPISASQVFEKVTYGDIKKMQVLDAYVRPVVEEVNFRRSGFLKEMYVVVGDEVVEGQILGILDDEWFMNEIESKKEAMKQLESTYVLNKSNLESLIIQKDQERQAAVLVENHTLVIQLEYDIKIVKKDLETLKKLYDIDKKSNNDALGKAKEQVGNHQIVAPFTGTVIGITSLKEGDYVGEDISVVGIASKEMTTINSEYIIHSQIKDSDEYFFLKDSKKYNLNYIPYDTEEYTALLLRGETPISTFELNETYDDIRQGDYGIICLIEEKCENVLTIPNDCVLKDKTGSYVYVLEDGYKTKRYIITGLTDTISIEIVEGLVEGDMVYVEY